MRRLFLTIQMFFAFLILHGQDVTIINRYSGQEKTTSPSEYVLKNVTEHTYIINEYELSNTGLRSNIDQMISYGLRSYIDNNYHVFDDRVEALAGKSTFRKTAGDLVKNAIWIHDQPFADEFPGFSEFIENRVSQLFALDGFRILTDKSEMNEAGNSEIGLYTFQKMVYDLKKACELEVSFFLDQHMPRTVYRRGDENNALYLSSKDFRLKPMGQNLTNLKTDKPDLGDLLIGDEISKSSPDSKKRRRNNKRSSELTERVVELLEQNSKILSSYNDRFENLQSQIDEVRNNPNNELSKDIAELRTIVQNLAEGKPFQEKDGSTTRMLTNEKVDVIFEKNAHELTLAQKAILNRALQILRTHTGAAAFITGYADKSGNPELNAWISKKRADAVRDYLRKEGIDSNRLVVNFLGDAQSDSVNPLDRKVSVTFVINTVPKI